MITEFRSQLRNYIVFVCTHINITIPDIALNFIHRTQSIPFLTVLPFFYHASISFQLYEFPVVL